MYTFRTITEEGKQINQAIGNIYTIIDRESNYEEFSDTFFNVFGLRHVADLDENSVNLTKQCHGFLQVDGDSIALYNFNSYYIMTESGKTFSNLSYPRKTTCKPVLNKFLKGC